MTEIKFSQQEWTAASDLAHRLLECLGPKRIDGCEKCGTEKILGPNYSMKYELAKALRSAKEPDPTVDNRPQWVRNYEASLMRDGGPSSPKPKSN